MAIHRVLAPAKGSNIRAYDKQFVAAPGSGTFVDVTQATSEVLRSNGWIQLGYVVTTATRPTLPAAPLSGHPYIDTTIGKAIFWDGALWRDVTGNAV